MTKKHKKRYAIKDCYDTSLKRLPFLVKLKHSFLQVSRKVLENFANKPHKVTKTLGRRINTGMSIVTSF